LQEPRKEEIAKIGISLDEKEESDDQEEEEWRSYPCLPPNKSNSLTNCRGNLETVAMGRLIGGARRW
jgi:hypothetical protein